jgi:small-conductance mechanosensitive channel
MWGISLVDIYFILYALAGFLVLWRLINAVSGWYAAQVAPLTEGDLDNQMVPFIRRMILIVLSIILVIMVFDYFDIEVGALITTLGVGSLAIGLAAQATLADTISGFVIMIDRPFRIGDRIELQDLNTWGDVIDIGLRSSRIRTRDNRMVIVPNSVIGKSLIVNHSYPDTQYRLQVRIGVAYGTDLEFARKVMVDAVSKVEGVLPDKSVEALFLEFGDSALIFRVRWWLESYVDTRIMFDRVNSALYKALGEVKIEIPCPQQEVHHRVDSATISTIAQVLK